MNHLLKNLSREQQLAMMRQQAPRPPDTSNFKPLLCECGCEELEPVPYRKMSFDPLSPEIFAVESFERRRCMNCKLYPVFVDGAWRWQKEPKVSEIKPA